MIKIEKKKIIKRICILSILFISIFCIAFFAFFLRVRPIILKFAKSNAETIVLNSSNEAVVEVLKDNDTDYDDIAHLSRDSSGFVTSLEIDIKGINLLKSQISNKTSQLISNREFYEAGIPLGTLLGNEFFSGIGPLLNFKFQLTSTSIVDFKHEFTNAGINQVLHKIIIEIKTSGSIITTGNISSFTVSTSAIATQTVIVGATPDAFTEVIEDPTSDTAGIINDYGAY